MNAYIKDIAYYLPKTEVTNEAIVRDFPEWSVEKIALKVGVDKRHVAAEDETALNMAIKAAERLYQNENIKKEDIDFLLGCSGYVYGLSLAKGLICSGIAKNVLLLTGETYSKHLHPRDKGNRTIFGDAASATVISTSGIAKIGNFSLGTDGSGAENLIIKSGGMRCPEKQNDLWFDENGNPVSSDYLYMNGSEIFTFTLDNVPPLVEDVLLRNTITKDEIDLYVFHQANKYMLNFLRKKIKIGSERFYICLSEYGNTVSNTIPIALFNAIDDKTISGKFKVMLAGFGVGYSWGGTVLYFG